MGPGSAVAKRYSGCGLVVHYDKNVTFLKSMKSIYYSITLQLRTWCQSLSSTANANATLSPGVMILPQPHSLQRFLCVSRDRNIYLMAKSLHLNNNPTCVYGKNSRIHSGMMMDYWEETNFRAVERNVRSCWARPYSIIHGDLIANPSVTLTLHWTHSPRDPPHGKT